MNLHARRDIKRRFWQEIRVGMSRPEAFVAAGVREFAARLWCRQAGGVIPAYVKAPQSMRYLSFVEREEILAGIADGLTIRAIARRLGRAPSTVQRELQRNMRYPYRSRVGRSTAVGRRYVDYRPSLAQQRADHKASRPKPAKLAVNLALRDLVQAKLEDRFSPEQIARRLRRDYPDCSDMWVSHEAIYQSIYVQGRGALRRELSRCLRTGRALRRPHRKSDERRGRIPGMVRISERPAEAEHRALPGHWEGVLLMGKNRQSAIGTLVERASRYVMLLHLPNGLSAEGVEQAITTMVLALPRTLTKSLTWDQGREMRRHAELTVATGLSVYFCDPAKPWQRGTNENTNGLLRQYFPRSTNLSGYPGDRLGLVPAQMNRRPRKTLGWDAPSEALVRLLDEASPAANVAPTN